MGWTLTTLGNYSKENADKLLVGVTMKATTAARLKAKGTIMPNIKTSEKVGVISTGATYQDGANCGFNALGDTDVSQREITVKKIKVNESYCVQNLEAKFTQLALPAGQEYDMLAFEKYIVDQKIEVINYQNELAIWRGDTTSGTHYLNKFDGFLKYIEADPTIVTANYRKDTGTITASNASPTINGVGTAFQTELKVGDKLYAIDGSTLIGVVQAIASQTQLTLTANASNNAAGGSNFGHIPKDSPFFAAPITAATSQANILDILDGIYLSIPEKIIAGAEQPTVYMGIDDARSLKIAMRKANLFHYNGDKVKPTDPFTIPALELECQPTPGLSGTGRIVVTPDTNLWLGTDLEDEQSEVKIWYMESEEEVRLKVRFAMGVNYAFGNYITYYRRLAA